MSLLGWLLSCTPGVEAEAATARRASSFADLSLPFAMRAHPEDELSKRTSKLHQVSESQEIQVTMTKGTQPTSSRKARLFAFADSFKSNRRKASQTAAPKSVGGASIMHRGNISSSGLSPAATNIFSAVQLEQPEEQASLPNDTDVALPARGNRAKETTVVSGWILLLLLDGRILHEPTVEGLKKALRSALADSFEVCHVAVKVLDVHAVESGLMAEMERPIEERQNGIERKIQQLMRKVVTWNRPLNRLNLTEARAVYEVRVIKEMGVKEAEVVRHIDSLLLYNKFADLVNTLSRELALENINANALVTLDDVGPALRRVSLQNPLTHEEAASCQEEMLLRHAQRTHESVLILAVVLMVLIICTGSTIFTIKQPSIVPSRMNPLIPASHH